MKNFVEQPPLYHSTPEDMTVAISSLSLGGAEKIVVDWLSRIYPKWRPHLIVLRDRQEEWPLPDHVRITRLHGKNMLQQLRVLGGEVANSRNPVCVCHLLNKDERSALSRTGAKIISVIHNAKSGWLESVDCLAGSASVVAVSEDCARSLRDCGWNGSTSVVRHIPSLLNLDPTARETLREQWRIPKNALVIGMIGAVKPQKNYPMALQEIGRASCRERV